MAHIIFEAIMGFRRKISRGGTSTF